MPTHSGELVRHNFSGGLFRWPEAFSRVVPEGDALAYDFVV